MKVVEPRTGFPALTSCVAAATGARREEILGLAWDAVDLTNSASIEIRQTLVPVTGDEPLLQPLAKTSSGFRTIPLGTAVAQALKTHRKRQAAVKLRAGEGWSPFDLVFVGRSGKWIHPVSFSNRFAALMRNSDLPPLRLHGLRHTFASNWLASGRDVVSLSAILGHSNPQVTLSLYSWAIPNITDHLAREFGRELIGNDPKRWVE